MPADKLSWLLDVFDKHFANSPSLQGLTFFLFSGVEFSEQKAPPHETLQAMIRVSIRIWQQIRTAESRKTDEYEKTGWNTLAINHPAGRIVEFWLKCWSFLRPKSGDAEGGWPDWLRASLEDIVSDAGYAGQLGRVIVGKYMPFVHAVDPLWARARLFPKFIFGQAGEEAFLLWEPHLTYGGLSRDLIIEMLPLYRRAFARFRTVRNDLAIHLYKHVAVILCSCLVELNQDGWFKMFLLGLSEKQRAAWANQMEFVFRNYPNERKQIIWDRWMKDYWQGRVHGKPCSLWAKKLARWSNGLWPWTLYSNPPLT